MIRKLTFSCILSFLGIFGLSAQVGIAEGTPTLKGYEIKITSQIPYEKLYLVGHSGAESYCVDSVVLKKGAAQFKSKNAIPCGVYTITETKTQRPIVQIILNKESKFSVQLNETKNEDGTPFRFVKIDGSEENQIFIDFLAQTPRESMAQRCRELLEIMPDAFVAKYLMASFGSNEETIGDRLNITDFTEIRMLHTPLQVFTMMFSPIENEEIQSSEVAISHVTNILNREMNPIVRNHIIRKLFSKLDIHNPEYDPALIYLYENYDQRWIEEGRETRYKRKIENLKKIVPGAQIPELTSHDKDGESHSTHDIQTHYTILWFWDPDCDHCQEMTPILHQMYQENADSWDFEVFAVEVNQDHDRWVAFSDKHHLWDWINLSTSMGEANIDYIEYFDIMTTPVIFLIDNTDNYTIIARQITLDELSEKLSNSVK